MDDDHACRAIDLLVAADTTGRRSPIASRPTWSMPPWGRCRHQSSASQAKAAATRAFVPVSRVGWMTGAKFGE